MAEWFSTWFDSPYYHLLYQNRDFLEAERFLSLLLKHLDLRKGDRVADIPCGKGRHSLFLHRQGLQVVGIDLANESIAEASLNSAPGLTFQVGDMRYLNFRSEFDVVFNLFTSFGYFDDENQNQLALRCLLDGVKPNGRFVMDFMNVEKVLASLVPEERKDVAEVAFHIRRYVENSVLVKSIQVQDKGNAYNFEERVRLITLQDLERYFENMGFRIVKLFGSYQLDEYSKDTSDRLIVIAEPYQ